MDRTPPRSPGWTSSPAAPSTCSPPSASGTRAATGEETPALPAWLLGRSDGDRLRPDGEVVPPAPAGL
ncbi:MAG TPA: hypothetical protein VFS29_08825 [Motilibacteraceae bacterium]|nr:hypothetical protein [Motilibacteraceae bacterium]